MPPARPLTLGASRMPTPPAFAPALYASHNTTKNATALTAIINQSLELKRPFMTPPTISLSLRSKPPPVLFIPGSYLRLQQAARRASRPRS
jgi:hypothetical protein